MADITNPTAIRFCNEQLRPYGANKASELYYWACIMLDEYDALNGDAAFPNDSSVVQDGASADGRPVITGAKVRALVTLLRAIRTDWEATSKTKLNTILAVASRQI